jgi:two-component system cell cycle sensor histidine kinase/response regulator CckA
MEMIETIKVLLIEDDEDDYILTRELLAEVKADKYVLDWASSYEEGLKVARRREHHVCLVDYRLGERTGVQLIREARESGLTTPMILLTGQGNLDVDVEAMEAGATDYMVKDDTPAALLERTIRYAVELNAERCRAEGALGAYAQKQAVVAEIGRLALTGGELKDLFAAAVSFLAQTLGVEYCKVLELLPDGDAMILRAGVGWKEEYAIGQATVSAGKESQAGFTLLSDEPVVFEDLRTETRFSGLPLLHDHGVVSGMSAIIRGRERPYGVLGAHTASERRFATDDVSFLRAVANVLAEAIDRKRAEDEVRQSEARFRRVVESNMLGIYFWDLSGAITGANDAFLNMVGYTREDLAAGRMRWTEMTPAGYRKLDEKAFEELAASGVCETYEKEYIHQDGSRVPILLGSATLEGEKHHGVVFVLDISDRKKAEESFRQSESQFRALFENALDAVLIANDCGAYVDANPAACELMGVSYNEVIGRTLYDFTEQHDRADASRRWEQFRKEGRMRGVSRLQRPDGKLVEVDFSSTANFLPGRHLSLLRDVTERRQLEEQLRQSQKLESVGMLAGGIAHDFNNLLTVITGYSELTVSRLDSADPLARYVQEIKKAADRATSLTRQLLAFSRKQVLQPKVLDLNSVTANVEKMLGRLLGEDIELRISPGVGLGQVKADPGQIEQVILNLVVNARDAMPKGGKITIETANVYLDEEYAPRHIAVQPGWYAMLAVTDTGHGMDAETRKQIFEPFFTTKEQGKGTGLGLSTVYAIVKQSGGNIWVYSEVGVGTTFKIYLPLVDEQVTEPDAAAARPESVAGTETILLAEDEDMVRSLARESLKMHGYTVLEAANAGEALLISQQHTRPIHLLLTDVVMPRMSGKELAEQLVRLRPDTRVLYMSGYTDQAIVHHGILDGDIAFIGKPFTPDALVLKVVEVLKQNLSSSQSLERIDSPTPDGSKEDGISYQLNELDEIVSVS